MGLFSFGAKKKEAPPRREAKPDTITTLALQKSLGDADLDYLLETYGQETWYRLKSVNKGIADLLEYITVPMEFANIGEKNQEKILSKLDTISSRLDEISHRLDALEQRTQDLPQRER